MRALLGDAQQASSVRAAGPTAWPAHSSTHLVEADLDAAFPGLVLPGRGDPADPLVSRQRGDGGPQAFRGVIGFDGPAEIWRQLVRHPGYLSGDVGPAKQGGWRRCTRQSPSAVSRIAPTHGQATELRLSIHHSQANTARKTASSRRQIAAMGCCCGSSTALLRHLGLANTVTSLP